MVYIFIIDIYLRSYFLSTDMNGELLVIKHLGVDMIFKKKRRVTDIIKLK